MQPLEKRI